jgi:hypothetical protein
MINLIQAIRRSALRPEDVIVVLMVTTGSLRTTLSIINEKYETSNCWMTYGSWEPDRPVIGQVARISGRHDRFPQQRMARNGSPYLEELIWELIDDRDFRTPAVTTSGDRRPAAMLPMLEIVALKGAHIEGTHDL